MTNNKLKRLIVIVATTSAAILSVQCAGVQANRREPAAIANGTLTPKRPAASQYGVDPALTCLAGSVERAVGEELLAAKVTAKPDGRLCAIAEALLSWEEPVQPDEGVLRFVSWYYGLPSPTPLVQIATMATEDSRPIAERLGEAVKKYSSLVPQARYGLGTERLHRDATRVVLVVDDGSIEVDAVPRRLEPGKQVALTGRFVGPFSKPRVLISDADGKAEKPITASGKEFQADLRCGDRPGLIFVQVRGESDDGKGERVLANFPVGCGTTLPTSVALQSRDRGSTLPVDEQERKIFEQINAERTAGGLQPLAWDDGLANVARTVSQKRAANPASAGAVDLEAIIQEADINAPVVLENPGQARTPEEAQARFAASPIHRSNFMSKEITKGGVGISPAKDPSGRSTVFISELFIRELPPVDTEAMRQRLAAAIVQRRADARAPSIQKDVTLEEIAQRYAKELAATKGTIPKAKGDELLAPVQKRFRKVNVLSGAKSEPLEFAEEPSIVSDAKVYGVGVAQGAHPTLGKNAVYVVVLLGTRR